MCIWWCCFSSDDRIVPRILLKCQLEHQASARIATTIAHAIARAREAVRGGGWGKRWEEWVGMVARLLAFLFKRVFQLSVVARISSSSFVCTFKWPSLDLKLQIAKLAYKSHLKTPLDLEKQTDVCKPGYWLFFSFLLPGGMNNLYIKNTGKVAGGYYLSYPGVFCYLM